jgi:hypothetical protein
LLYPLWTVLFGASLAAGLLLGVRLARRYGRRRGFATRTDLAALVTGTAVLARVDVLRPGLTVLDTDPPQVCADKARRRTDPLEVSRRLGTDVLSGEPVYLANEYTLLVAASARFGGKTSRYVIPSVVDARGAVISTSTRLDVAETTYTLREAIGPTWIFEPQGEIPGVPRLRWSPIEGAEDRVIAMLRANGFAAASGIGDESVENGRWFRDQGATIIRGLLHAAALDGQATMTDVLGWAMNPGLARPEHILRHHGVDSWADRLTRHRESGGRARDTIQSVVAGALDAFHDPRVLATCSPPRGQQFQVLPWLGDHGTLFVVGTRDAQALTAPLLAAIIEDLLFQARRAALTSPGGRIEPALYLIGDEIANIAPIPSLPAQMTDGGGAGIATSLYTQNQHQLRERWGDKGGQAIRDAANATLIIGGSIDATALRDLQTVTGHIHDLTTSTTYGHRTTHTDSQRREPLLDLADLRTLPTGRAIALIGNMPPVELDVPAWWDRPDAPRLHHAQQAFRKRLADTA